MKNKFIACSLACTIVLGMTISVKAQETNDLSTLNQTSAVINNLQSKKILISDVKSEPATISPGQTFSLTFKLTNNHSSKLENVSLKVVGIEGKNLLTGFSPVGTTNEIYGGTIAKNGSKELSIKLISDPSLKVGLYNFQISVTFNAPNKSQEEITKVAGIVVKNTPNLTITSLKEDTGKLSASFINAGKGPLNNVLVNFKIKDKTYSKYFGTLDAEVEENFEENLEPVSENTKGTLEISFIDEMGTEGKVSKELDIKAESVNTAKAASTDNKKKNSFLSILKRLFGLGD
ncbi:MAG: hypothetical protein N2448_10060 [Caloramator sp.]|nr:hypothetical protein [Caloramator sp.]